MEQDRKKITLVRWCLTWTAHVNDTSRHVSPGCVEPRSKVSVTDDQTFVQQAILAPLPQMRPDPAQQHLPPFPPPEWPTVWKEAQRLVSNVSNGSTAAQQPETQAEPTSDSNPLPAQPQTDGTDSREPTGQAAEQDASAKVPLHLKPFCLLNVDTSVEDTVEVN